MRYVHSIVRWLSGLLLHFSLLAFIAAMCFQLLAAQPQSIKGILETSGVYDTFVNDVIADNQQKNGDLNSSLPLDDPNVKAIVNDVFSPQLLRQSSHTVIDGTYEWLQQKSDRIEFSVNLAQQRTALIDSLSTYASVRLEGMPACSAAELQQGNVFKLQCEPPGFYQEIVKTQVVSDLTNSDFLSDPVISDDSLPRNSQGLRIDEQFSYMPTVFGVLSYGVLIASSAVVAASVVYISVRRPKRKAIASLARDVLTTSVTVLGATLFYVYILPELTDSLSIGSDSRGIGEVIDSITNQVNIVIINTTIQMSAVGAVVLVAERMTRPQDFYAQVVKKSGLKSSISTKRSISTGNNVSRPPVQTSESSTRKSTKKRAQKNDQKFGL